MALIRQVWDYGSIACGLTVKSLIGKLGVIQAQALRVCYEAFKTLQVPALQVEMREMPLDLKKKTTDEVISTIFVYSGAGPWKFEGVIVWWE